MPNGEDIAKWPTGLGSGQAEGAGPPVARSTLCWLRVGLVLTGPANGLARTAPGSHAPLTSAQEGGMSCPWPLSCSFSSMAPGVACPNWGQVLQTEPGRHLGLLPAKREASR